MPTPILPTPLYLDPSAPIQSRIQDLLSRLTLA